MKKYLILLAMLLVAVANYAEKPANYVEASQEAYRASDPLMLEGYFTGDTFSGQIELMTANQIPGYNTPTRLTIVVSNPVLSSYNWSVSGKVYHLISLIAIYVKYSSRQEDHVAVRLLYQVLLRLPVNR